MRRGGVFAPGMRLSGLLAIVVAALVAGPASGTDTTADVSVVKTGPASAVVGELVSYSLTVTNLGPDPAANVVLVDQIPGQVRLSSMNGAGCTFTHTNGSATGIRCAWDSLGNQETRTVTVNGEVRGSGEAVNTATVSTDSSDPDPSNNNASVTTSIPVPASDVSLSKTAPAQITNGSTLEYHLTVRNSSSQTVFGTTLSDTLPAQLARPVSVSFSGGGFLSCSFLGPDTTCIGGNPFVNCSYPDEGALTFTCTIDRLPANSASTITIRALAATTGTITNTATLTTPGNNDPDTDDHTATATTEIQPPFPPPAIVCPPDVTVSTDPGSAAATVDAGTPTVTDGAPPVTVTGSRAGGGALGAPYPTGTTTITWLARDSFGRETTCVQTITVLDREPPTLTAPPDLTVPTDPGQASAIVRDAALGEPTAADNVAVDHISRSGVPAGNAFPVGTTTITYTATDTAGNTATATQRVTVVDEEPPAILCGEPDGAWHGDNVGIACTATDVGSGLADPSDASFELRTNVADGDVDHDAATGSRTVCDASGNCAAVGPIAGSMIDRRAPTSSCAAPSSDWHGTDVARACTASDDGSGLADAADAAFSLVTSVAPGVETDDAQTNAREVCDAVGNCSIAGPLGGNKVDKKGPVVNIAVPADGSTFVLNASVPGAVDCADQGSGVATCSFPPVVATDSPGLAVYAAEATDRVGNVATRATSYAVVYATGPCLGEPGHSVLPPISPDGSSVFRGGRTVPVKFRVCDANGTPIGVPGVVTAFTLVQAIEGTSTTAVLESAVSTSAHDAFRFDSATGQWIFNLSTTELAGGRTYVYRIGLADGTQLEFRFGLR